MLCINMTGNYVWWPSNSALAYSLEKFKFNHPTDT
jgi:hypothetical protein